MHDACRDKNDITGNEVVCLIFNKITAISLCNIIDFKVIMAVLAHGLLAETDNVGVNVEIKFATVVHVFSHTPLKNVR